MIDKMGDSSYHKLKNIKGIFDNIPIIEKALENRLNQLPDILREKKKITNWIVQIKKMNDNINNIKKSKIVELERDINYNFAEPDLVVLSFIQPSIINIFRELYTDSYKLSLNVDFEPYMIMDEMTNALALFGDAAINLALLMTIPWQPDISNAGWLTIQRARYANNENLARICDKWGLYDFRIHLDSNQSENNVKKLNHAKATIVEAIFGVIYIEAGLDQVILSIDALK
jgi:ribonuclease-3